MATYPKPSFPLPQINPSVHPRARAIVTVGLMLGMLITAMESTVVSTAMPTVIGDLHGIRIYPWVFSAYLLASTTTVPIYGKFADLYGRRRVFLLATAIFLVGSLLSGAAHTMPQLIAFRALQGLGAGGVLPLTLTVIGDLYKLEERARVQGLFTSMWGISSLGGPILGAWITQHLSWRWVFTINLPVGLLSALLVGAYLKETQTRSSGGQLDYAGLGLLTGAVVSLLTLLQAGSGATPVLMLSLVTLTVSLLIAFIVQERRAPDPMLPLDLFQNPVIAAATIGNILIGLMMFGVDTFMPLFMQGVRGGGPESAGLVLTPLVLLWSISAYVGARALVRYGFQALALFGVSCILIAALSMAAMTAQTPTPFIVAAMAILGCGLGPCSMTFLMAAQNAVSWQQRGVVTASSQFFRSISGAVGVGALGALLNMRMAERLAGLPGRAIEPNSLLNAHARARLAPDLLRQAEHGLSDGLHAVFLLMAFAAVTGFFLIIRLARRPEVAASVRIAGTTPAEAGH